MKRLNIAFLLLPLFLISDEGMWLPHLLEQLIYSKMKSSGLKVSAEQIYSINKASMKDAVMLFGRGCTAEAISPNGLIITNHHCGYGSIVNVSSPDKNYLKNGFWAKSLNEEIPCPNLSVTFIRKIEDVSNIILAGITSDMPEIKRDSIIQSRIKKIENEKSKESEWDCMIKPFYYGNEYLLFYTETFKDVRLVGTPEEVIGKFGGETDNWVWPRHNPDFCMFRIYADKNNKPAEYSPDNVPYKPQWYFPISIKPLKENDFTMVYGFPGQTQEYLPSYAVDFIANYSNPIKVKLREIRLKIYEKYMAKNDTFKLMYADRYAGVANYYKKMMGESMGINKTRAIEEIRKEEELLLQSASQNPEARKNIKQMLDRYQSLYEELKPVAKLVDYYHECLNGVDIFRFGIKFIELHSERQKKSQGLKNKFDEMKNDLAKVIPFKNYYPETDKELFKAMMREYDQNISEALRPAFMDSVFNKYKGDYDAMAEFFYSKSKLCKNEGVNEILQIFESNPEVLTQDPLYRWISTTHHHYALNIFPVMQNIEKKIQSMHRDFMRYQIDFLKNKTFYPDANSTLRVSFGKIQGMKPRDGVEYACFSTVKGMWEKNKTGNPDYEWTPKMEEMIKNNRFGSYANNASEFRISFIATNHTTGGNSGSPVLNAKGELIGINYDRCWESTMSDLYYNIDLCRNIALDMKFMLWFVDMYAGAGHLLKEMKILK
ncbi:MAG: S46 family peptidase [Bacteroidia bacterium]|nr:S46 family peptidase [Bacteroidia bacterium]